MKRQNLHAVIIVSALLTAAAAAQQPDTAHPKAERYIALCQKQLKENEVNPAIKNAEKAIELDRNNPRYHFILGNAYGQKAQQAGKLAAFSAAKKCRSAWERVVELDPDHVEARFSLFSYYLAAPGIVGGGRDKAEAEAAELMARDSVAGHMARARLHTRYNDLERAETAWRRLISLQPDKAGHLINFGLMYQHFEAFDDARTQFIAAARMDSPALRAYYHLADNCLLAEREYLEGVMHADYFIDNLPESDTVNRARGHCLKGNLYRKLDEKEKAMAAFQKALQLNPECEIAAEGLNKL